MHECKWCDKEIEDNQDFCSPLCRETYQIAKEHDEFLEMHPEDPNTWLWEPAD